MTGLALTSGQTRCLADIARHLGGSAADANCAILGIADLANSEEALGLARSMLSGDWNEASRHKAIAGNNDLLIAFLLRSGHGGQRYAWALLRSPADPWESDSLESWGAVAVANFPPDLDWTPVSTHQSHRPGSVT